MASVTSPRRCVAAWAAGGPPPGAGGRGGADDVHGQARMLALQLLQPGAAVDVARRAHADVQVDRVAQTLGDRAAQDGQDRRQTGATGDAQHRPVVSAPQVGRPERAAHLHGVTDPQAIGDVAGDAPVGHAPDMELEHAVAGEAGHRIRSSVLGRELELHVLAGRELDRLGRSQHQPLDVVRQVLDRSDGGLDDARRVHHDLVGLRDLDRARLGEVGLAGEHVAVAAVERPALFSGAFHHLAVDHAAAAGAAAPRHARVRHRHLRGLQRLQQIGARFEPDHAVEWLNEKVHGGVGRPIMVAWGHSENRIA
jgi:hypothetical protein